MNNKSCPSLEAIAQFSVSLPDEQDLSLASHIFSCPDCSELLGSMLEVLCSEEDRTAECDSRAINRFLQNQFGEKKPETNSLWEKFNQLISDIVNHKVPAFIPSALPEMASSSGNSSGGRSFSSSGSGYSVPQISMVFSANTDENDSFYWKAVVQLPVDANNMTLLSINVTGRDGEPVSAGKLHLFGKNLQIADGFGQISFADFKAGLRIPTAEFTFLCGTKTAGDLKLI